MAGYLFDPYGDVPRGYIFQSFKQPPNLDRLSNYIHLLALLARLPSFSSLSLPFSSFLSFKLALKEMASTAVSAGNSRVESSAVVAEDEVAATPVVADTGDTGESGKLKMIISLIKKCLGVKDIASMCVLVGSETTFILPLHFDRRG